MFRPKIVVIALALVMAGCSPGSSTEADADADALATSTSADDASETTVPSEADAAEEPADESSVGSSIEVGSVESESVESEEAGPEADETADVDDPPNVSEPAVIETTLPLSNDPCVEPAAHRVGGEQAYEFEFEGEARPIGIRIGDDAMEPGGRVVVLLHPLGIGWRTTAGFFPSLREGDRFVIAPQSQAGSSPSWTLDETFNVRFLEEVFELLPQTICLEDRSVEIFSTGQGSVAASQFLCERDVPVVMHTMSFGLVKIADCAHASTPAIVGFDRFDFDPAFGTHWDGAWEPPLPFEQELTGGVDAVPLDFAHLAEGYGCTAEPERIVQEETAGVTRVSEALLVSEGCAAPILSVGVEFAGQVVNAATRDFWEPLADAFANDALGR